MRTKNAATSNLKAMFLRIEDCIKTYKKCSKNIAGNRYLVQSEVKTIDFDHLTKWLYNGNVPKSADTLNFEFDGTPCFIEFRDSNFVNKGDTRRNLIKSVIGKMNDSDTTLRRKILNDTEAECEQSDFFLVVSVRDVNVESIDNIQAELSDFDQNVSMYGSKEKELLAEYDAIEKELLADLKEGLDDSNHFREVDIWHAELFDKYLEAYGIKDVDIGA